ncbi:MAG: matrixin family metalloprotease [archaeon]|nr:MAG: matrixin family metalloprotease [archaeon]
MVFSVGLVAAAGPDFIEKEVTNPVTEESKNTVALPARAVEVAPNVFYLGLAFDKGTLVEGYAFVDYRERFVKPGTECGNGICEPGENPRKCPQDCTGNGETSDCYGFLSRGAKWKEVEPYTVNPINNEGLDFGFVYDNLASDISKWETAAGAEILGTGTITNMTLEADTISPDGKNEVYFGDIDQPGAIGVTIVWGVFSGPPKGRKLVEWDQIYDQVDFDWSDSGEPGKMDFESIATHELGHSVGLDDLYDSGCSEMTMYGYADYGETKKRTLEDGDITGVSELYG